MNRLPFLIITGAVSIFMFIAFSRLFVFAHEEDFNLSAEAITAADLHVEESNLLPTSPIYFLKEWGRAIRLFFRFNPVAKAEYQLQIASEKLAEAKKLQVSKPDDERSLVRALENYQKAQEKLRSRLESLPVISHNPNMDHLLNELAERMVAHEKLFDEILQKTTHDSAKNVLANIRRVSAQTLLGVSKKDDAEKFAARLEAVFNQSRGSQLKDMRSLELLEFFKEQAQDDATKRALEEVGLRLRSELRKTLERLIEEEGIDSLASAMEKLPGDAGERAEILEDLEDEARGDIRGALEELKKRQLALLKEEKHIAEKAREQIEEAEEELQELMLEIERGGFGGDAAKNFAEEAEKSLTIAKSSYEEERYGEAFGHAMVAEALARNGVRSLEEREEISETSEEDQKEIPETLLPEAEKKQLDLEECGPQPLAPGEWVCKDGKWQLRLSPPILKEVPQEQIKLNKIK